jgi:hypothetical protein
VGCAEFPSVAAVSYSDLEGGLSDIYIDTGEAGEEDDSIVDWDEEHNIASDPLFGDEQEEEDQYHLQSTYGRWKPSTESWVTDQADSPCLDAGDGDPLAEPEPAGFLINMGAYGGTVEASKSKQWRLDGDVNNNCQVDISDLIAIRNVLNEDPSSGDNWKADVNEDGNINILDLIYSRNRLGESCD